VAAFKLRFSPSAKATLKALESGGPNEQAKLKKVRKALAFLEQNPRYPGLNSHQYETFPVGKDVKVWDSYVENRTPSAWRIFWCFGPDEPGAPGKPGEAEAKKLPVITVLAIGPHPD
jgi:hypothetical protein